MSLGDSGFHVFVRVKINGHSCNCILDTGASRTVLDVNQIEKFNLSLGELLEMQSSKGVSGNELTTYAAHVELQFGRKKLKHTEVTFIDLSQVNLIYEEIRIPLVQGIIGADLLFMHNAVVSFEESMLYLW